MTTTEGMESMIDESQGTPRIATSVRVCADHETCERNKRAAFRKPQTCLTCERREATHFIADDSAYMLRCDECLVSNFGCPHAAPNVCTDCYDALTLDIYDALRSSSDVRMETLLSTLRAVEEAVREEHDPLIEWTADLPEMIRVQQSEHMRVLNATRNLAADNAAKWKSELSAALSRAERAEAVLTKVDVDALVAEIAADISLYHDDGDYGTCAINYCAVCGKYWGNCKQDGHERTAKPCNCSVSRDIAIMTDKLRKALGEP
jgi:hypothetical protein